MTEGHTNHSQYETNHVHDVYDQIAQHFSSTRYKVSLPSSCHVFQANRYQPWPIVHSFLTQRPSGSIGLDIGCGNGKYLQSNRSVFIVASDYSHALARIASQHQPHATLVADNLFLPHPKHTFDFAISIAVIHHLSSRERRIQALEAILECLRQDAKALVYVWALEQKDSRRGWHEGMEQDVMVPWVMKGKKLPKGSVPQDADRDKSKATGKGTGTGQEGDENKDGDKVYQRYYHLYQKGELEDDIITARGKVVEAGYEKDNWWAIMTPNPNSIIARDQDRGQDPVLDPESNPEANSDP